ncbi:MAG: uroporphyrinogen decarboxylase family protein [Phycisphaerae bacterium]|nr:uroporphyrinogen decarboxylase family protein [Phycisphaerae bacterium]
MTPAQRLRATYEFKPVDHLVRQEFYIWTEALDLWRAQGSLASDANQDELFGFDPSGAAGYWGLGWCDPAFCPAIEPRVLETSGDYEIALDKAGRTVKYFKGRRHGFMPTYLRHAVTCDRDWEENVAPLLRPDTPARWAKFDKEIAGLKAAAAEGKMITQHCIGGYMYLRALVGPEEICYLFLDNPALVHRMMQSWLEMADAVSARVQEHIEFDEFFIGEDICYNHGLLISPDMVRRFLWPYYQQILANVRSRQKRRVYFHCDTDGNCDEAVDLYREIGLDKLSPIEIAAGNDVVAIARKYPDLIISGGIDKRVLADGREAIDEYLGRIMPPMVARGGYVPTCDHGVPDNVSFDSYMHYRRRMMEMDH